MNMRMLPAVVLLLGLAMFSHSATQGDKDDVKPVLGDRDDIVFQNQRFLKVKNDTASTWTVSVQFRTLVNGVFTWLHAVPKDVWRRCQSLRAELEALSIEQRRGRLETMWEQDHLLQALRDEFAGIFAAHGYHGPGSAIED